MSTVEAYFPTKQLAADAQEALGVRYACTEPEPVRPVQGNPWKVVITPPATGLGPQHPNPNAVDHIVSIVLKFGGITTHGGDLDK